MHHHEDRHQQQAEEAQRQGKPLEAAEVTSARRGNDNAGCNHDTPHARDAEVAEGQVDADELGNDGKSVQDEQIDDAECAPELAEAFEDQAGMANPGHNTETDHHLLIHIEHRHEQQQRPKQSGAVVLAGLGVGAEGAGIVVANHDDQAGANDRHQRCKPCLPGTAM